MNDYYTLDTLPGDININIERLCFCHVPLIYIRDWVPTLVGNPGSQPDLFDLEYKEKPYLLMKKSTNKRWGDISFFNFNMEERPTFFPRLTCNDESFRIISEIYRKGNCDETDQLQRYFYEEFNLFGQILNFRSVHVSRRGDPICLIRRSRTVFYYTLYLFYFYQLHEYRAQDIQRMQDLLKSCQSELAPETIRQICPELAAYLDSLPPQPGKEPLDILESASLIHEKLSHWQADQISELIAREVSILIPTYFFTRTHYKNLHPNFRFHALIPLLIDWYESQRTCLSLAEPETSLTCSTKSRETVNTGVLMLDLVDFKTFFNKFNYQKSLQLVKAFQTDIAEIVHQHSGYIYDVAGDSFLVLVQQGSKEETLKVLLDMALDFQCSGWKTRIGLSWVDRPLFEGYVGPLEIGDFELSGPNINIAARLEQKIKQFDNCGILMTADISREKLQNLIDYLCRNRPRFEFKLEEKQFSGIPEMGGPNQVNRYFYITCNAVRC